MLSLHDWASKTAEVMSIRTSPKTLVISSSARTSTSESRFMLLKMAVMPSLSLPAPLGSTTAREKPALVRSVLGVGSGAAGTRSVVTVLNSPKVLADQTWLRRWSCSSRVRRPSL